MVGGQPTANDALTGGKAEVLRIVVADCSVDYTGRLTAHLPRAKRVLLIKADGSVLVHSDGGSYKPLNWMNPPCRVVVEEPTQEESDTGVESVWRVVHTKTDDELRIRLFAIEADNTYELGQDPGLIKDGVESHLQELLAEQLNLLGPDHQLVRREYPTAVGPVDILTRTSQGHVAVEIKRRGDIDGVEQLTRYLDLLNRDPMLSPVEGVFAAQEIRPQARTLAEDRGIRCVVLDYDAMRGMDDPESRLF